MPVQRGLPTPEKTSALLIKQQNAALNAETRFLRRTLPRWLIPVNSDILRKSFSMTTVRNLGHALAISGGAPVRTDQFPPWPAFEGEEIEAAAAALHSGRVTYSTGDEGRAFEREFADFTGCEYAIALANGTVALELALYYLGEFVESNNGSRS